MTARTHSQSMSPFGLILRENRSLFGAHLVWYKTYFSLIRCYDYFELLAVLLGGGWSTQIVSVDKLLPYRPVSIRYIMTSKHMTPLVVGALAAVIGLTIGLIGLVAGISF